MRFATGDAAVPNAFFTASRTPGEAIAHATNCQANGGVAGFVFDDPLQHPSYRRIRA